MKAEDDDYQARLSTLANRLMWLAGADNVNETKRADRWAHDLAVAMLTHKRREVIAAMHQAGLYPPGFPLVRGPVVRGAVTSSDGGYVIVKLESDANSAPRVGARVQLPVPAGPTAISETIDTIRITIEAVADVLNHVLDPLVDLLQDGKR